jgi:hypothetical protein
VCSGPLKQPISDATDWAPILTLMGYDPNLFTVVGDVLSKTWFMGYKNSDGEGTRLQLWSYKATIALRTSVIDDDDYLALLDEIRAYNPPKRNKRNSGGDWSLVVALADWQMGKRDGDGTRGTIARVLATIDQVAARLVELRMLGRPVGTLVVAGQGDLVEGCSGFYPQQQFTVELDRRGQVKIARRLLVQALKTWAPLADRVVVACVPGNHGENRQDGKSFTTFADNDDVAVFEMVAEVLAENPASFGHVTFNIPTDDLVRVLNISGHTVAFTHGHAAASGSEPGKTMWEWWKGHAMGVQPAGDAEILVAAHFHQFTVRQQAGRALFVCPPLDGGSKWFTDRTGLGSKAGTLTFVVGPDGWQDLQILDGAAPSNVTEVAA